MKTKKKVNFLACLMGSILIWGQALVTMPVQAISGLDRLYEASWAGSMWENKPASRLSCEMSHVIPGYGTAIFEKKAGKRLHFKLQTIGPEAVAGQALVMALPNAWQLDSLPEEAFQAAAIPSREPIQLEEQKTEQILAFLEKGTQPAFLYQDQIGSIQVALSGVRFQTAYQKHLACLKNLLTFSFEDIQSRHIFFQEASSELTESALVLLGQMALYYEVDKSIQQIHLVGHSDNLASRRENYLFSLSRVDAVREYLIKHGVPTEKIVTDAFGEREPIAKNDTPEGRAQNRRVEITIEK